MGQLIIITLLAAGMLGMIKTTGGIDWMLTKLTSRVKGSRGAQACITLLVGVVNLCTANNTVAIITVGSLSQNIAQKYGISRHRQLHSSMPHPLRCADTPRHRFGRHIPRCPLALSVLPLDPRTDDHHLHTDQTQNRIIRRVRRSISSSERKQMRREMWRSEEVSVFGVSPI